MRTWIAIILVMMTVGIVQAQNEAIPACTDEQIQLIDKVFKDNRIISSYKTLSHAMEQAEAENGKLPDVILLASGLQQRWWDIAVSQLPDCALSYRIQHVMGRILDETLIFSIAAHWSYLDITDGNQQTVAVDIMQTHVDSLQNMFGQIDILVME